MSGKMKKDTHSCGFYIAWDAKDRGHTSELLERTPCGAEDATLRGWMFPAAQVVWQGAAVAKVGASLQKSLLPKALLLLLLWSSGLFAPRLSPSL